MTLEESSAKYKFVFTHHVLGTGRGGDVLDNSGNLNLTVLPEDVSVDYFRSYRREHETEGRQHGELAAGLAQILQELRHRLE